MGTDEVPAPEEEPDRPGFFRGRQIWTYMEDVRHLIQTRRLDEAETLLNGILDAEELFSRASNTALYPDFYNRLMWVYRRKHDLLAERNLLRRYAAQRRAHSRLEKQMLIRLGELEALEDNISSCD